MQRSAADAQYASVLRHLEAQPEASAVALCPEAPAAGSRQRPGVVLDACLADVPLYRLVDLWSRRRALGGALAGCAHADVARARLTPWAELPGFDLEASPDEGACIIRVEAPPVRRRGLLGLQSGPGVPGVPAHTASDEQGRLVESLRVAGINPPVAVVSRGVRLEVGDCTACGVCVRACPQGALVLNHEVGRSVLAQRPDSCRGDRTCIAVCPEQVVVATNAWPLAAAVAGTPHVLAVVATRECRRCRTPYPALSHPDLCPMCRIRTRRPLGSVLPPETLERLRRRGR